jgi:hypothetical protein
MSTVICNAHTGLIVYRQERTNKNVPEIAEFSASLADITFPEYKVYSAQGALVGNLSVSWSTRYSELIAYCTNHNGGTPPARIDVAYL